MVQTVIPDHVITVEFQEYDIQGKGRFVAWIKEPEYRGIVIEAASIVECLEELSISLKVLHTFRKNNKL